MAPSPTPPKSRLCHPALILLSCRCWRRVHQVSLRELPATILKAAQVPCLECMEASSTSFRLVRPFPKGLTFKMGQTHVHKYMQPLLDRIENDEIDPSFVITHRLSLDDAAEGYKTFKGKPEQCIKVELKPSWKGEKSNGN